MTDRLRSVKRTLSGLLCALATTRSGLAMSPIAAVPTPAAVTSIAVNPKARQIAIGKYQQVLLSDSINSQKKVTLMGCSGNATSLCYSPTGDLLFAAGGQAGRTGEIAVYKISTGKMVASMTGPDDVIQSIAISPDGKLIVGGSYDHSVYVWSSPGARPPVKHIQPIRVLRDHTDAVYSVAFSPDGTIIASAAGDRTVKLWSVKSGKRLQTLSESTGELNAVCFSPDGKQIAAAGADRIIRVWTAASGNLVRSAFAHDGAVLRLAYSHDGRCLVSTGEDRAVKSWNANTLQETNVFPRQSDWPQALALDDRNGNVLVGCHDGTVHVYQAKTIAVEVASGASFCALDTGPSLEVGRSVDAEIARTPGNESLSGAQPVPIPCSITGELWDGKPKTTGSQPALSQYYRFHALHGIPLSISINARRAGSPLDSYIQILDTHGHPVEQAVLRSVGQSEITLFDKDSAITGIRLLPFPDLQLNDYVLIGRELLRVGTLPKGPDDDTQFRSIHGQRVGYLGTNPEYHSIGTKVFRVEVHPPGSSFSPNGMPLVHLMYENDDGGPLYGRDSYLEFHAPADGDYVVRVSDARGKQGKDFRYKLEIHEPRPDYRISISPGTVTVPRGGFTTITVECDRFEGFDGPIHVELEGLPPGFHATSTDIEAGETSATLLVGADETAIGSTERVPATFRVKSAGTTGTGTITQNLDIDPARKVVVGAAAGVHATTDKRTMVLAPGSQSSVVVTIQRSKGFTGRVPLDVRNLPFGVKVLDVGLNGILVNENETTRRVVLSCEPWVKPQTRSICVFAGVEGGVGSGAPPVELVISP